MKKGGENVMSSKMREEGLMRMLHGVTPKIEPVQFQAPPVLAAPLLAAPPGLEDVQTVGSEAAECLYILSACRHLERRLLEDLREDLEKCIQQFPSHANKDANKNDLRVGVATETAASRPAASTPSSAAVVTTGAATLTRDVDSETEQILLVDEVDVFFGQDFYGQTHNQAGFFWDEYAPWPLPGAVAEQSLNFANPGSVRHQFGDCKPCVKYPLCKKGATCNFCHLHPNSRNVLSQKRRHAKAKAENRSDPMVQRIRDDFTEYVE